MSTDSIKKFIVWMLLTVLLAGSIYGLIVLKGEQAKQAMVSRPSLKIPSSLPRSTHHAYHSVPRHIISQPAIQAFMAQDPDQIQLVSFFSYGCYGCMLWHP